MRAAAWMSVPGRLAATTLPTVTGPVGVNSKFSSRVCFASSCSPSVRRAASYSLWDWPSSFFLLEASSSISRRAVPVLSVAPTVTVPSAPTTVQMFL